MDKAVLGVDSCKKGWCGVILGDDNLVSGLIAPTIAELVEQAVSQHPVTVVAIDIPIGLPTSESREADVLARRRLGPRASSVFPSPMMSTMNMATHAGANAENSRVSGKGLSVQSFGILPKIRDVEEWLRVAPPVAVIEIHPEVSFAELHGAPLDHSKKTLAGAATEDPAARIGWHPPQLRAGRRSPQRSSRRHPRRSRGSVVGPTIRRRSGRTDPGRAPGRTRPCHLGLAHG